MNCFGMHRIGRADDRKTIHCGAETTNGLALCELCQRKAKTDLEFLPVYFRNLARWRPGGAGSRSVPSSCEPRSANTSGDRVGKAMDAAGNDLTTWARALVDDRPQLARLHDRLIAADIEEHEVMAWLCRGFDRYLPSIAMLDWCGQFVADIAEHEETLQKLTLDVVPGWYAGSCRRCEAATYVVPGLTWVTCGGCGVTTFARDHVETILTEARGWIAPPKALAGAIVAMLDSELSVERLHERIRQWSFRERVSAVRRLDSDGDEVGAKRYRLGEVLDVLLADGATRIEGTVAPKPERPATLVTIPGGGSVPILRWVD